MCNLCGSGRADSLPRWPIHFPGSQGINKPAVFAVAELSVCLNCGKTELTIPEGELRVLAEGGALQRPVQAANPDS